MTEAIDKFLRRLASLKITVTFLAFALVLIFLSTLAQVDENIWTVQREYYHSWIVLAELPGVYLPGPDGSWLPAHAPLPGGYAIAVALLINLAAATYVRFKIKAKGLGILAALVLMAAGIAAILFTKTSVALATGLEGLASGWGRLSISALGYVLLLAGLYVLYRGRFALVMLHMGIAVLLIGQVITSVFAVERRIDFAEGQTVNFTADFREPELVIIDPDKKEDNETIVDDQWLHEKSVINDKRLPFEIRIGAWYENSALFKTNQPAAPDAMGIARWAAVEKRAPATGSRLNQPAALLAIYKDDAFLGRYIVSYQAHMEGYRQPVFLPREDGDGIKEYWIDLRPRRNYTSYEVTLVDAIRENYPGSTTPKHYESKILFTDAAADIKERPVSIYMNHPYRYRGETFFQAGMQEANYSILQVVENPAWEAPYHGCLIVALGMTIHFMISIVKFAGKRARQSAKFKSKDGATLTPLPVNAATPASPVLGMSFTSGNGNNGGLRGASFAIPAAVAFALVALVSLLMVFSASRTPTVRGYDIATLGEVPILHNGRVKPIDTAARANLIHLTNKQSVKVDTDDDGKTDTTLSAMEWYITVLARPSVADTYPIFRVDHPELRAFLGEKDEKKKLFSLLDVAPRISAINDEVEKASNKDAMIRTDFEKLILGFGSKVNRYLAIRDKQDAGHINEGNNAGIQGYVPLAQAINHFSMDGHAVAALAHWRDILTSYRAVGDAPLPEGIKPEGMIESFNQAAAALKKDATENRPAVTQQAGLEVFYNRMKIYIWAMALYVVGFLLAATSLMVWPRLLRGAAFGIVGGTFILHTLGLGLQMYLHGRPPVTDLYSSAVFIGWFAVMAGILIDVFARNAIGLKAASICGLLTLIIAHNLNAGDNFKTMQAVLDSNFWLTTHVIAVTIGYAATFLAGFLAIVYLLLGILTPKLDQSMKQSLFRSVWGVVCFAALFSLVGTLLGGIWADQSWGRFWGWDPKENGALMIVIVNAIILHAYWGGLTRERGTMLLAIFGNIVTAWSWFGTNMLGVGLHSYGFMEAGVLWLWVFVFSQLIFIAMGLIPQEWWWSYRENNTIPKSVSISR